ncbi:MAG: hypothetical protein KC635_14245, partial [Myxococcales bacterium]|nr:hypothetical protein [Myxococcales bacterium]
MKDGGPLDWGGGSIAGDDAHLGDSAWSPAPADPPPRDAPAGAAADRYAAAGLVGRGGMGHVS